MKRESSDEEDEYSQPKNVDWVGIFYTLFNKIGISVVFIYAAYLFYQDQRTDRQLLLESYMENAVIQEKTSKLLSEMHLLIKENTEAIKELQAN
jgi:hypothetical protein